MRLILNVLWVILGGGWLIALEYVIAGALLCLTVVGIPFGLQCFKIARLGLWPFGRDLGGEALFGRGISVAMNVVWLILAGLWIFLSHLALGVSLAVTIIGIPFAYQHLKLGLLALAPFGQRIR